MPLQGKNRIKEGRKIRRRRTLRYVLLVFVGANMRNARSILLWNRKTENSIKKGVSPQHGSETPFPVFGLLCAGGYFSL